MLTRGKPAPRKQSDHPETTLLEKPTAKGEAPENEMPGREGEDRRRGGARWESDKTVLEWFLQPFSLADAHGSETDCLDVLFQHQKQNQMVVSSDQDLG